MGVGIPIKKVLDEKDVLKKLDIPDFRHMSKDKIMEFCSMYDRIDPEVAKAAIAQFPEFAKMLLDAAEDYKEILQDSLDKADESTKAVFESYDFILETLRACASDESLSEEDKRYYIDKMVEIAQMKDQKGSVPIVGVRVTATS